MAINGTDSTKNTVVRCEEVVSTMKETVTVERF